MGYMHRFFSFYLGNARRAGSITLHVAALGIFNVFSLVGLEPSYGLSDFNIAVAGDWGCNSNTDKTVNNIVGKSPEPVLGLGDYSYQPDLYVPG